MRARESAREKTGVFWPKAPIVAWCAATTGCNTRISPRYAEGATICRWHARKAEGLPVRPYEPGPELA